VRSLRLPEQPAAARPRGAWLSWMLVLVLAASTGYLGYVAYGYHATVQQLIQDEMPGARKADTDKPAPTLAPAGAVAATGKVVLESKGYIIPAHQILVSPKVGGMVVKLNIEEGMRVQKGTVLAELETIDYRADRDRAKAFLEAARQRLEELENGNRPEEIQQAEAELEEAKAQREQLYLDWKRTTELKTGNAMAARDYEQAYSSFKAMDRRVERLRKAHELMKIGPRRERIEAARAEVRQAEADLIKAEWRLGNCTVYAPVSGTILTKKAEEGNIVNPSAFSNGLSASLCEMADLSDLEVELSIQERDIAKVARGQRCKVRPEAFPERVYEGVVSRLMPIADRAKGAIPVRVKLTVPRDEEGRYLKPEMGAVVSFLQPEKDPS
jgi:multidrug resistance efflux pump